MYTIQKDYIETMYMILKLYIETIDMIHKHFCMYLDTRYMCMIHKQLGIYAYFPHKHTFEIFLDPISTCPLLYLPIYIFFFFPFFIFLSFFILIYLSTSFIFSFPSYANSHLCSLHCHNITFGLKVYYVFRKSICIYCKLPTKERA